MTFWSTKYHLTDKNGREVCVVFWDEVTKSWGFEDFKGNCEYGVRTDEKAITYCDEYMWNAYGI